MSKFLNFVLVGALLLAGGASWISPKLVSWYASPPVAIGVTCDPAMNWAMGKMAWGQLIGLAAGSMLGAFLYYWLKPKTDHSKSLGSTKTEGA